MEILKVQLTADNVKNLSSNAIPVLPGPGVAKGYLVHDMVINLNFGTVAFDSLTDIAVSVNPAQSSSFRKLVYIGDGSAIGTAGGAAVADDNGAGGISFIENVPLYLAGSVDSVAGDSTVDAYIVYSVIDL